MKKQLIILTILSAIMLFVGVGCTTHSQTAFEPQGVNFQSLSHQNDETGEISHQPGQQVLAWEQKNLWRGDVSLVSVWTHDQSGDVQFQGWTTEKTPGILDPIMRGPGLGIPIGLGLRGMNVSGGSSSSNSGSSSSASAQ